VDPSAYTSPVSVSSIAAGDNNVGNVDIVSGPWSMNAGAAGAAVLRIVTATDDPVNDYAVKGDANMVAHDAADAGNPLKIGCRADTAPSGLTLVADADRSDCIADADGGIIARPYALADRISGVASITDGSSTSVIASAGAGIKNCFTTVVVSNSSATNVTVDIRDGTAGSVLMTVPASANMGGAVVPLPVPICGSAATALAADPSASASTIAVTLVGTKTKL
jgi:hypothetical protein